MLSSTGTIINCPQCGASIPVSDALAGPAIARIREEAARELNAALAAKDREFEENRKAELAVIQKRAREKAESDSQIILSAALDEAADYRQKYLDVEEEKLGFEREKRAFADTKARFELEKTQAVNLALNEAREQIERTAHEKSAQEVQELKLQLCRAQDQAGELKRKLEQKPSQELQGEAFEEILEERLCAAFRSDFVEPVKKGQRGADLRQVVNGAAGPGEGTILWEFKKAQNWSNEWPVKAKANARAAGCCAVVIVSDVMPKDVRFLWHDEAVYLCEPALAVPLASILRRGIMDARLTRLAVEGRTTKAQALWDYMTGPEFRAYVQEGMEAYQKLRELHDQDVKRTTLRWRATEKAHQRILDALCGIRGGVEGLGAVEPEELDSEESLAIEAAECDESEQDRKRLAARQAAIDLLDEEDYPGDESVTIKRMIEEEFTVRLDER